MENYILVSIFFTAGRSTLSNLLQFDKYIADYLNSKHSFDKFSFDFCKA